MEILYPHGFGKSIDDVNQLKEVRHIIRCLILVANIILSLIVNINCILP